ncbi:OmpA family protein [Sphingomonas sinipercae]|nr:OmpA family protein [Sphingomonas sinipercae]
MRAILLAGAVLLSACGRQGGPGSDTDANRVPENSTVGSVAAGQSQSIIRNEVLEETETPEPAPEPRPEATISFEVAGKLPDTAAAKLDEVIAWPQLARGSCLVVSGHTDSRGSDEQNLRASTRRAELVRDYLVDKGIAPDRIAVVAVGERRPVAPNANEDGSDNPAGRARNRRVEVRARDCPAAANSRSDTA